MHLRPYIEFEILPALFNNPFNYHKTYHSEDGALGWVRVEIRLYVQQTLFTN